MIMMNLQTVKRFYSLFKANIAVVAKFRLYDMIERGKINKNAVSAGGFYGGNEIGIARYKNNSRCVHNTLRGKKIDLLRVHWQKPVFYIKPCVRSLCFKYNMNPNICQEKIGKKHLPEAAL